MPRTGTEQLARQRVEAAGWRPITPFPGRIDMPWRVECTECGETAHVRATPNLKPCRHRAREKDRKAREKREAELMAEIASYRQYTLEVKNLRELEPWPGMEQLWWVQCKFCSRKWRMPENKLRACPHKGDGGAWTPPPSKPREAKVRAAPPPVEEMAVTLTGHIRRAFLWQRDDDGPWVLRVGRGGSMPQTLTSYDLLLHQPLDSSAPEPPVEQAEEVLTAAGWTVMWKPWDGHGSLFNHRGRCWTTEITSGVVTEYEMGREILGSVAARPDVTARACVKRHLIPQVGRGRDSDGKLWKLYLRAEVEAKLRIKRGELGIDIAP